MNKIETAQAKVFEIVSGATLVLSVAPSQEVQATLQVTVPGSGRSFTFTKKARADQNGSVGLLLPYATDDEPYLLSTGQRVWVSEEAVLRGQPVFVRE